MKNKDVEQTKGWVNQVLCFMLKYSYFQPIEADEKSMVSKYDMITVNESGEAALLARPLLLFSRL